MELKPFDESTLEEQLAAMREFDKLPERVRQYAWDEMKDIYIPLEYGLFRFAWAVATAIEHTRKCQSPIEQLLYLGMEYKLQHLLTVRYACANIYPQKQLCTPAGTYRVDFLLTYGIIDSESPPWKSVVVECDGHEWHEKTKQQAAKDKKRDRAIQALGFPVMRFTGSEIVKDPTACVQEMADFINNALS